MAEGQNRCIYRDTLKLLNQLAATHPLIQLLHIPPHASFSLLLSFCASNSDEKGVFKWTFSTRNNNIKFQLCYVEVESKDMHDQRTFLCFYKPFFLFKLFLLFPCLSLCFRVLEV